MKKLMSLIIFFSILNMEVLANPLFDFLNEYSFGVESGPTSAPPFCGVGWGTNPVNQIPDVSLVGDSRSYLLALAEMLGDPAIDVKHGRDSKRLLRKAISNATIYGNGDEQTKILKKPIMLHNLGWPGAAATDKDRFFGMPDPGSGAMNWNRRWDRCKEVEKNPYITSPKMILHLGGNDMVYFYDFMKQWEALYEIIRAFSNPAAYLVSLVTGRREKENELFWLWQFEAKEDRIVEGMKAYSHKLIEHNGNHAPQLNEILLVDIAPAIFMKPPAIDIDLKGTLRLNIYLSRLNFKYYKVLFPYLIQKFGANRIHFLDMFVPFLRNIGEGATYYIPGDGIHFFSGDNRSVALAASLGNEHFGKMVAAKMALIGWFPRGDKVSDEQLKEIVGGGPGYDVDGPIVAKYKELGGAGGIMGFTRSEIECFGPGVACTTTVGFFDCGTILYDSVPVLGGLYVLGTEVCGKDISKEDKDKPPFFEDVEYGRRWFEHNILHLSAKTGTPPFRWTIKSGSLPPGTILDSNGIFRGSPTNNAQGDWRLEVEVKDAKNETHVGKLHFTTGL